MLGLFMDDKGAWRNKAFGQIRADSPDRAACPHFPADMRVKFRQKQKAILR